MGSLKRARAPSPIPIVTETEEPESYPNRVMKRQRVAPPTMDGRLRGWEFERVPQHDPDEDGFSSPNEEDLVDEHNSSQDVPSSNYTSTNNLLHELHRIQLARHHSAKEPEFFAHPAVPYHLPSHQPSTPLLLHEKYSANELRNPTDLPLQETEIETAQVAQRYEDTNRLLGSLFLSRRKALNQMEIANS